MSRPNSRPNHARRLLMEPLEDRRVMTDLIGGAAALEADPLLEVTVTEELAAPARVMEQETAQVTVVAPSEAQFETVHEQIVELNHDYQDAQQELREDYQEARADLRDVERELRSEITFETPAERVEFNAAVNDARVELKQDYHQNLNELREDFQQVLSDIVSNVSQPNAPRGNDQPANGIGNSPQDSGLVDSVENAGNEPIGPGAPDASAGEQTPVGPTAGEGAKGSSESSNQGNSDATATRNGVLPRNGNHATVPADALVNQQQAQPPVTPDGAAVRPAAHDVGVITAATAVSAELTAAGATTTAAATTGLGERAETVPVALVIAGTESEGGEAVLQGVGLAPGDSSFTTASLDAALQQIMQSADQLARSLTQNPSLLPWLLATLAGGIGLELYRRKKKAARPTLAASSLTANSTLSWVPGMPGSFSDEVA
jgi:hypothetical protein